jgi:hypothetical protein
MYVEEECEEASRRERPQENGKKKPMHASYDRLFLT